MNTDQIPESANKGLENIVACTSQISTIHNVTLLYRGYTIEDLATNCSFEEVIYLLWYGSLPNASSLSSFKKKLYKNFVLPKPFINQIKTIAKTKAHSMAKLRSAISCFALYDKNADDISIPKILDKSIALTAAIGPIVAALSRLESNLRLVPPNPQKGIAWNFLNMINNKAPTTEEEKLFDTALVLHADHELNASSFTARVVASTTSDYYSDITAAVCSLKGPLHGGANEHVMLMLKKLKSVSDVDSFIEDAIKNRKKVMGIGHRVYKNGDPRAKILKELSLEICKKAKLEEKHKILVKIEEMMDSQKGLMPNVDFYSGLVYTALKLKPKDFTPVFAVSRISGWSAQILEQYQNNRIYRPRAHYTGLIDLTVKSLEARN